MAMVTHIHTIHTAGKELTPEQIAEIREAAKRPYTYDPDCPLLTEEQLTQFHPVHFATWEEQAKAMRDAGITTPDEAEEFLLVEKKRGFAQYGGCINQPYTIVRQNRLSKVFMF